MGYLGVSSSGKIMFVMTPEQQARVNIDNLLKQAGWTVQDVDSHVNLYASQWSSGARVLS